MKCVLIGALAAALLESAFAANAIAKSADRARDLAASCFACHGTNGNSVGDVPPSLAGRDANALFRAMKEFQSGARASTVMQQQAKAYTDDELEAIATYFSRLERQRVRMPAKPPS